jgi:flagellar biosynthetic protein FlhB
MAEQDSDLTEEATQYKLDQARDKGSVARSPDLVTAAMMVGLVLAIYASAWDGLKIAMRLQVSLLGRLSQLEWTPAAAAHWLGQCLLGVLTVLGPLFMILFVIAILANFGQSGPVFSLQAVKPDLTKLNPMNGMKRVFSMRTIYESVKSIVKFILLGGLTWMVIRDALPGLLSLVLQSPKTYLRALLDLSGSLLVKLVLALVLVAVVDLVFTRWEFAKRMRMSKRDIRDESKNREGDPRIRSRIRQLRKDMLKRSQSLLKVPSADVLVTNPTHIAIALCYDHGKAAAPHVVAKGAGELARNMRRLAERHNIPIVQNRALARALFREVGHEGYVPEKLYPQVARIMVWVYAMRAAKRASGKED